MICLSLHLMSLTSPAPYSFEKIDKEKAILLIVDHQLRLLQLVKDYSTAEFRNNVLAHAELGKLFDLPVVMTTSAETGRCSFSIMTTLTCQDQTDLSPRNFLKCIQMHH